VKGLVWWGGEVNDAKVEELDKDQRGRGCQGTTAVAREQVQKGNHVVREEE